MPQPSASPSAVAGVVVGQTDLRIWSLPSAERLRRQFRRAGMATEGAAGADRLVLLRADWVYDEPIVRGLAAQQTPVAVFSDDGTCVALAVPAARRDEATAALAAGQAPADLPRRSAGEVAGDYNAQLRKREPPFLLPLVAENLRTIEARVFAGSYKGVTDFVTLYFWPRPARAFTGWCAARGITPNMVTSVSLLLVFVALWAFWNGHYGWGLAAGWFMTFLDTVDGKLARVTLNSSKFGDLYDHLIDLLHPPFWWWAWVVGLAAYGTPLPAESIALTLIVVGYVVQRVEEGVFEVWLKMSPHVWQRFDSVFRRYTARRNPNLAILTVAWLFGRPDLGIQIVAAWVVICLAVHTVRLAQAALARRRGPLQSWLA